MSKVTNEKMDNEELTVVKKGIKEGRTLITILSSTTYKNFDKGPEHARLLDYDDMKDHVIKNWKTYVVENKRYQINVLINGVWRANQTFQGTPNYNNFFDGSKYYADGDEADTVVAIQIIQF